MEITIKKSYRQYEKVTIHLTVYLLSNIVPEMANVSSQLKDLVKKILV